MPAERTYFTGSVMAVGGLIALDGIPQVEIPQPLYNASIVGAFAVAVIGAVAVATTVIKEFSR